MSSSPTETGADWRPSHSPWWIAVSVILATFMEVLDTSVANVSLPHIAGNLSATTDESTWVLTSYLVANAIVLPASGWLSHFFGRKRFLLACIIVFTVSSALAGLAPTLTFLVIARAMQGAGGGALQPVSQAILLESFPPSERGVAMAVFGMGVVVAPTLGPLLGGWLTDHYSWRWIFYINLPVGILSYFMVRGFIEDPPYIIQAMKGARTKIDYLGLGFMTIGLASLQVVLDKGQEDDWFSALWIRWVVVIASAALVAFLIRELLTRNPIVNLRVLKNWNFTIGTTLMGVIGAVLYSTIALLPLFMQTLMGYSATDSGYALAPRGVGAILAMIVIGRITKLVDNRLLVLGGFGLLAYSSALFGNINLQINIMGLIWPNFLNGIAVSFIFVPLTTLTMGTLANEQMGNATAIFNLVRNMGGSIGISLVTTMLARHAQAHQIMMVGHLTPYNFAYEQRLHTLTHFFSRHFGPVLAEQHAHQKIYHILVTQSRVWAYVDNFRWVALISALCILLVLLFQRVKAKRRVAAH